MSSCVLSDSRSSGSEALNISRSAGLQGGARERSRYWSDVVVEDWLSMQSRMEVVERNAVVTGCSICLRGDWGFLEDVG